MKKLKAKHPDLDVLISLGGWTWSRYFSDAALTEASRQTLVESCIDLFLKGNLPNLDGGSGGPTGAGVFDGIDLDWEWPGSEGNAGNIIRPEDKRNFTLLLAEFRAQLDEYGATTGEHYDLTAFLPAAPAKIDAGFEVDGLRPPRLRDGPGIRLPRHVGDDHQPPGSAVLPTPRPRSGRLQPRPGDRHVPGPRRTSEELVVGVPYFGRGWTGVPNVNKGLYQTSTGPAPATFEAGVEDYKVLATSRAGTPTTSSTGPTGCTTARSGGATTTR